MLPTYQRFHPNQVKVIDRYLWLILNEEFLAFEARAQIAFEYKLAKSARRSPCRVELIVVAPLILRPVECGPCAFQERCSITSIVRMQTNADAIGNADFLFFVDEWLNERFLDCMCGVGGV